MTLTDLISHGVTAGGAGAITAAIVGLARWARHRERGRAQIAVSEAEAEAAEAVAREQGAAAVVPILITRIETVERGLADCNQKHTEAQDAHRECMEANAQLRSDLAIVSARVAEQRAAVVGTREDTGVHELRAIAARSLTPPEPIPAVRDERETMLPPAGGESEE